MPSYRDDPDDYRWERDVDEREDMRRIEEHFEVLAIRAERAAAAECAPDCAEEGTGALVVQAPAVPEDHEDARCPSCQRRSPRGFLCAGCVRDLDAMGRELARGVA